MSFGIIKDSAYTMKSASYFDLLLEIDGKGKLMTKTNAFRIFNFYLIYGKHLRIDFSNHNSIVRSSRNYADVSYNVILHTIKLPKHGRVAITLSYHYKKNYLLIVLIDSWVIMVYPSTPWGPIYLLSSLPPPWHSMRDRFFSKSDTFQLTFLYMYVCIPDIDFGTTVIATKRYKFPLN